MKTFILTSFFWLVVLGGALAVHSARDRARWADFQSDAVLSMNQFMERLAKQEDSARRASMAAEMGSAMKAATELRELKFAMVRVSNKY